MATYTFTHPDGQTVKITGDSPPDEATVDAIFAKVGGGAAKAEAKKPDVESLWQRTKSIAGKVAAEPFKLAGEAVMAPIKAGAEGVIGLTKTLPATLGTLAGGGTLDQALQEGTNAGDEARTPMPFQSETSKALNQHVLQPGLEKLGETTGQPELVSGLAEFGGDVAGLMGIKPTLSALGGTGKNLLRKLPESGIPYTNPEKLYASAVKLPLSKAWTKVIGPDAMSKRTMAVKAGLEGEVPPTELGIEKAKNLERDYRQQVDSVIAELDSTGKLIPKERLKAGLSEARKVARAEGTPEADRMVDRLYDKRFEKMGKMVKVGEKQIPDPTSSGTRTVPVYERQYKPSEIQEIKRHLYKMENYEKAKLSRGLGSQLKELGNKGMAHEAKTALEEQSPELKNLNQNDAAYINLREALERAVPRIQNRDMGGLGFKILLTGSHPGMAILELISGAPRVKAATAIALNKARKIQKTPVAGDIAKSMSLGVTEQATQPQRQSFGTPE